MKWFKARIFGVAFFVMGLLLAIHAVRRGGWWWGLLWPAVSLWAAGIAYLWLGPGVFGKTPLGTRRLHSRLILMPYCGANWLGWRLLRFVVREDCWNEAAPKLYIGRRAYGHELPPDAGLIVDLTAEFIEPIAVRTGRRYVSFPILDAYIPHSDEEVLILIEELGNSTESIYIHCAEGHGRAAMIAALVLVHRGVATDGESALAHLQKIRPRIKLRPHQREALERWIKLLFAAAVTPRQTDENAS